MSGRNDNLEIDIPMVNATVENLMDVIIPYHDTKESLQDGVLKIETWIMNFTEEQIKPLRESGKFTEAEIEELKKKMCVISPMTLTLYVHWLQWENYSRMSDSEKERMLLEKVPDRFKARFKGNASNRQAREVTADEEAEKDASSDTGNAEEMKRRQGMSFIEFLKEFGIEVKAFVSGNEGKAA